MQIPLKLAYAITMHKAQGMNLQHIVGDAKHAHQPGQLATAVGRATSPEGLQLVNFNAYNVPPQPVEVVNFLVHCNNIDMLIDPDLACCRQIQYVGGCRKPSWP